MAREEKMKTKKLDSNISIGFTFQYFSKIFE